MMECKLCHNEVVMKDMQDPWGYSCPASDFGHETETEVQNG